LQTAQALRFLKENIIYHLDLKPTNILISKNYISKITDFGESYNPEVCGPDFKPGRTFPYACPEVVRSQQSKDRFNEKVDVFSLGVLISDLIFDEYPVEFKRGNQQ
jgi:serine/threonine protein kinase